MRVRTRQKRSLRGCTIRVSLAKIAFMHRVSTEPFLVLVIRIKKVLRPAEQTRPDVMDKRRRYQKWLRTVDLDKLVFLDGSFAHTPLVNLRPFIHWHPLTMIGAVPTRGWLAFSTSWQGMNKVNFTQWTREVLVPRLRCGDIVVMDHLRAHHGAEICEMIEAVGASIKFLPPYSPDFNPIESCWSLVKMGLRKVARRSKDSLRRVCLSARYAVTP